MAMETLVVLQHQNQYHSKEKSYGNGRLRQINCRTFQSEAGILPTPLKACTTTVTKRPSPSPSSPKTPLPCANSPSYDNKHLKTSAESSATPINIKASNIEGFFFNEDLYYSELWAGPAYSNSPPPSSLPIPKFPLKPKRTVSLDLPGSASDIELRRFAKSAPPSPTRELYRSPRDLFLSADSATKTLRRILNIDIGDE